MAITRKAEPLLVWSPSPLRASENCVGYMMDMKNEMPSMAYSPTMPPKPITTPHNTTLSRAYTSSISCGRNFTISPVPIQRPSRKASI